MARSLERLWPGLVTVKRRFGRPQHVVRWNVFKTPLQPKPGIEIQRESNEYGLSLVQKKPVRSDEVKALLEHYQKDRHRW